MTRRLLTICAAIVLLLSGRLTNAMTITLPPWEVMVGKADFVGIVECTVAGGGVAKYKVIECWKGSESKGNVISIHETGSYYGSRFPIALHGEQYVIAAKRTRAFEKPKTLYLSFGDPLFWRLIPSDYKVSPYFGRHRLGGDRAEIWHTGLKSPDRIKEVCVHHATLSPDQLEFRLLQVSIKERLQLARRRIGFEEKDAAVVKQKRKLLDVAETHLLKLEKIQDIFDSVIKVSNHKALANYRIHELLSSGGNATLALVENMDEKDERLAKWQKEGLSFHIRRSLGMHAVLDDPWSKPKNYTDSDLDEFVRALEEGLDSRKFELGFEVLSKQRPAVVAKFLKNWERETKASLSNNYAALLPTYFVLTCPSERIKYLTELTAAKKDMVRAIAAVYLTLDDEEQGLPKLYDAMQLPGRAGGIAAINVLRRGDKSAMPRVLELFAAEENRRERIFDMDTQKRAIVLIANSCQAAGISRPGLAGCADDTRLFADCSVTSDTAREKNLLWWQSVESKFVVHDPWFEVLAEKKID